MQVIDAWKKALRQVIKEGFHVDDPEEGYVELPMLSVRVSNFDDSLDAIHEYVDRDNIEEMRKVFVGDQSNKFGHNYWPLFTNDGQFDRAIRALKHKPVSRKAVLAVPSIEGISWVPCVNCLHFWPNGTEVNLHYFSRAQDIFVKFIPDLLAMHDLLEIFVSKLDDPRLSSGEVRGVISSAHIYDRDIRAAKNLAELC